MIAAGPGWSPTALPAQAVSAAGVVTALRRTAALLDGSTDRRHG
ncbi:hypothetical protein ACWKSP_36890 [Micromonosporaceae bacterium Da 78-11]